MSCRARFQARSAWSRLARACDQRRLGGGRRRPAPAATAAWYCAGSIWIRNWPLRDEVALAHRDPDDAPGDVGADVDRRLGLDLPARGHRAHQVAPRHLLQPHLGAGVLLLVDPVGDRRRPRPARCPRRSDRSSSRATCAFLVSEGDDRPRLRAPRWPCGNRRSRSRNRPRPAARHSARPRPRATVPAPSR